MFFVADSDPTLPYGPGFQDDDVRWLEKAIEEAGFRGRAWFAVLDDPEGKNVARLRSMAERIGAEVRVVVDAVAVAAAIGDAFEACDARPK